MIREQAVKHLHVIREFAKGKTIQVKVRRTGNVMQWVDTDDPSFYSDVEYRVKPEPRTFYLVRSTSQLSQDGFIESSHASLQEAKGRVKHIVDLFDFKDDDLEIIKVMEIVE